eukprot:scaffold1690_cov182-Amphora_coffeaeformis.AAC.58
MVQDKVKFTKERRSHAKDKHPHVQRLAQGQYHARHGRKRHTNGGSKLELTLVRINIVRQKDHQKGQGGPFGITKQMGPLSRNLIVQYGTRPQGHGQIGYHGNTLDGHGAHHNATLQESRTAFLHDHLEYTDARHDKNE